MHLFSDDKIIPELPKNSKQRFASLCESHLEPLKEVMPYGSSLIDLF